MEKQEKELIGQGLKITIETGREACCFIVPRHQDRPMSLFDLLNDQHHQETMMKWCRAMFSIPSNYKKKSE